MEVNLTIDQGNSSVKVALFDGERLVAARRYESLQPSDVAAIAASYSVRRAIYSSVRCGDSALQEAVKRVAGNVVILDHNTPMPMTIDYTTPATLGHDRIAAAVGAIYEADGCNCIIIDAGTAVTLDTVTADRHYRGGNISLGLRMRFEALHHFTSRLPMVSADGELPLIGHDTATAIRSGVILGLAGEINQYVANVKELIGGDVKVIITGGDREVIAPHVAAPHVIDENLLMKGLNRILLYNEKI